jgi:hypothetical protein
MRENREAPQSPANGRRAWEARLCELDGRVHGGAYQAQPSRGVWIPKADGRQRPLGVAALEDKIVPSAVGMVLNQIWEEDSLGFSYGFRPGRSQQDAVDALWVGIVRKKVNWILDLDIRSFFDKLQHDWLVRFVEHRIGDKRVVRLIQKWLKAEDAERFLEQLRERLRKFGLELHAEKTRLIEFGRYAAERREKRREGKPETFHFLGFTHICGTNHKTGKFTVHRKTIGKRMAARLKEMRAKLRRRMHASPKETGKWLAQVVRGYFQYHAIPGNWARLAAYRNDVLRMWFQTLRRRSQRSRLS